MKFEEIAKWKSKSDFPKLVSKIQELVVRLSNNGETHNRRQLVEYLNESIEGIDVKEGVFIKYLLKEAYESPKSTELIKKAIVNNLKENTGNNKIYNPERIFVSLDCLKYDGNYFLSFDNKIQLLERNANKLKTLEVEESFKASFALTNNIESKEGGFSLTGNTKVNNAYKYALGVRGSYESLIAKYEGIKDVNLNLISDFVYLRNELLLMREDLMGLITDFFGNNIKNNNPELFDFDAVEWFDFEKAWGNLDMYFNKVDENLKSFKILHKQHMQSISSSGSVYAKNTFNTLSAKSKSNNLSKNDVKSALATAAVGFAIDSVISVGKSRNEAKKTVARIKSDVEDLKIGMQNDYELMMNDLLRILSIYSSLNDKLIPSVKSFIRLTSSVIKSEINPIYNELSNIYGVKELRDENSNLIKEGRLIDVELIDKSDSLNFCKDEEIRLEKMLKMMQFEYDFLLEIKPIKPSSFYKIISFGRSESLFEKVLIDWENSSSPKINQYVKLKKYHDKQENIRVDIKKDVEHLNARKIEVDALVKANSDRILNIYKQSPISVDKIKLLLKNMKIISQEVKNTISVGLLTEDLKVLN